MIEPIDRRRFLANAGLTVTAALACGGAPLSFASVRFENTSGTGHVDDACGHWPPYSHPIPYGHASTAGSVWEQWDAIDHIFML